MANRLRVRSQGGEVAALGPDAEAGLDKAALAIRIASSVPSSTTLRERHGAFEAELEAEIGRGKGYAKSLEAELRQVQETLRRDAERRVSGGSVRSWWNFKARLHRKRTPVG